MYCLRKYWLVIVAAFGMPELHAQIDASIVDEDDYNASIALYNEAKLLIYEENYLAAVDLLQQAYEIYNGNSDYAYAAAFAYYKLGRLDAAANKIEWSLGLEPFQSDYLVLAGNIAYKRTSYQNAVRYYSKALQFQDSTEVAIDDITCYYNRGNCYLQLEDYKAADNDYSYVLDVDQYNFMAFHNRGLARLRAGKKKEACFDFQSAIDAGSEVSKKHLLKYCQ